MPPSDGHDAAIEKAVLGAGMMVGGLAAAFGVHYLAAPIGAYLGAVTAGVSWEELKG